MNIKSHFDDIRERIIEELKKANTSIFIAVAWFTDKKLFEVLCQKASLGVKVELIAIKDEINTSSSIDFSDLFEKGGKIWLVEDQKTMHNKFCIIDDNVVINGSYNWTYNANNNHENIMIVTDHYETVVKYINQFKEIKKVNFGTEKEAYNKLSLRLSALKNVILLNDSNDIEIQIDKIRKLSLFITLKQFNDLKNIFNLISSGRQNDAIMLTNKLIYEANNHITEEEIAENSYNSIFEAAINESIIGVTLFLKKGVKINVKDREKNTALHHAAKLNSYKLIKFLINNHAKVNILNSFDENPIDLINEKKPFYIECFELLLNNNANIDPEKKTLSIYSNKLLNSQGLESLKRLFNKFENIEEYTRKCYFIDNFFRYSNEEKDFLISKGVNINQLNSNNEHLFDTISYFMRFDQTNFDYGVNQIKYLIEKGIDWKRYYPHEVYIDIILENFNKTIYSYEVINYKGQTPLQYLLMCYDYNVNLIPDNSSDYMFLSTKKLKFQLIDINNDNEEKLRFKCNNSILDKLIFNLELKKYKNETKWNPNPEIDYNDYHDIVRKVLLLNNLSYSDKNTLMVKYLQKCLFDLVKILVLEGADVNIEMKVDSNKIYFPGSLKDIIFDYKNNIFDRSSNDNIFRNHSTTGKQKNIKVVRVSEPINNEIIYNKVEYLPYISCLEFVRRADEVELYNILLEKGAILTENDIKNIKIEEENKSNYEVAKLKFDSEQREIELEAEKKELNNKKMMKS